MDDFKDNLLRKIWQERLYALFRQSRNYAVDLRFSHLATHSRGEPNSPGPGPLPSRSILPTRAISSAMMRATRSPSPWTRVPLDRHLPPLQKGCSGPSEACRCPQAPT